MSYPFLRLSALVALLAPMLIAGRAHAADNDARGRPRIEVALGMGASLDDAGLSAGLSAVPSFFVMGGFGAGTIGLDFGLFANSANGRYRAPSLPVDRLAFDGMAVIRPLAAVEPADQRYRMRVARALAVDVGLGYERASRVVRGSEAVNRFGTRVGAHVDIPLTSSGATSELRLRLAVRRFVSASHASFPGGDPAPDTRAELFAALAAVF